MSAIKTIRWIELIDILVNAPSGLSTALIRERLRAREHVKPVDIRTVQRDLTELENSGFVTLQRVEREGQVLWSLFPGSAHFGGASLLTRPTAITLKAVMEHAIWLLPPEAQEQVLAKSEAVRRTIERGRQDGQKPWLDKVRVLPSGYQLARPQFDQATLRVVYQCLANGTCLRATYRKPGASETSRRDYCPLALVYRAPRLHLLVSLRPDRDPFVLAVHRMSEVEALDSPVEMPDGFDLDAYIAAGRLDHRLGEPIRIRLRCTPELGDHWDAAALGADQVVTRGDGHCIVEATCPDTAAFRAYLLGLGPQVVVLSPPGLRDKLTEDITRMAERYATET